MPVSEARIRTSRASRYLVQLCRHAKAMGGKAHGLHARGARPEVGAVEWTGTAGKIEFSWGRCILRATEDTLIVRLDIDDEDRLRAAEKVLAATLERFGRRDGLRVAWDRVDSVGPVSQNPGRPRKRRTTAALAVAVVLAVAAHLVVGGLALASWEWTSVLADILLGLVVLKIVVVAVLSRHRLRNGHARLRALHRRQRAGRDRDAEQERRAHQHR
ncbi:hypothetical protein GCM10022222_37830 [Amycolatopsis ultiminotia]|uniref:DUF2218 domain-containing protein n=1 Tax=Amycolatopsis ultiminotia TaxID=543629 RepID=A0ABP6WEN4_9PSEU